MQNGYLSIEEVARMLNKSTDQVKAMVREGSLREYRDGGKTFYKKDDIEQIKAAGSSIVDLDAMDLGEQGITPDENDSFASALKSLADSSATLGAIDESPVVDLPPELNPQDGSSIVDLKGGSGSVIGFAEDSQAPAAKKPAAAKKQEAKPQELSLEDFPEDLPAQAEDPGFSSEIDLLPVDEKEDTHILKAAPPKDAGDEVPDLGLSGSSIISLEPSGDTGQFKLPTKEPAKPAKVGINVFDDDELQIETDPLGETQISAGVDELESVGSGSGLLDLTQESDDTSLGAELLDVISPTESAETIEEPIDDTMAEDSSPLVTTEAAAPAVRAPVVVAAPRVVAPPDTVGVVPTNLCLFLGILAMAVLGLATASVLQGVWPSMVLDTIARGVIHWSVFGGLLLLALGTGVWGIMTAKNR